VEYSLIPSEVWLDYQWDEYASNVMHTLTVANTPKDIEVLTVKGIPPELEIPEIDYPVFARVPAIRDEKTGSYAKGGSSIAEDYSYISAPTPDGKAVLIDIYLDHVIVLDPFGNKYAEWSLASGTFAKLISATSDLDSLWLLYWENKDEDGNNTFRVEQRLLLDGSLVEYEAMDGLSSEVQFDREWNGVRSELDLHERNFILSEPNVDFAFAIDSFVELSEITSGAINADSDLIESSQALNGDAVVDILTSYMYIHSETAIPFAFAFLNGDVLLADLSRNFVWSIPELEGAIGYSDALLADCEIGGIEVHAWSTAVQRGAVQGYLTDDYRWSCVGSIEEGNEYLSNSVPDFDLMDVHHEWTFWNSYVETQFDYDPYFETQVVGGFFTRDVIPGLDRNIQYGDEQWYNPEFTGAYQHNSEYHPNTRLITSPVIQASESNLYVINTVDRKWLNLRDTTKSEGDPERRTVKSVLYRFDKSTKCPIRTIKPAVVSMSCAYGRAATDALGLILADVFFPKEYSFHINDQPIHPIGGATIDRLIPEYHYFKEGDMLIFDEYFNLTYDEPMAFPILPSSYQSRCAVGAMNDDYSCNLGGFGDSVTQKIRQFSTVLAYGNYIVTAVCVEGYEGYYYTGTGYTRKTGIPFRVRFRVYDHVKNSYQILGGHQGALLSYSVQEFYNYVQSEVPLMPENAFNYTLSEVTISTFGASMIHSEGVIQIDEAVSADIELDTTLAVNSSVDLGFIGYREIPYIITNTSPVCTKNRDMLSVYENLSLVPLKEDQPQWAIDQYYDILAHNMLDKDFTMGQEDVYPVYDYATWHTYIPSEHSIGCYPAHTTFWTKGLTHLLKEDGTIQSSGYGWVCTEESAMFEASALVTRDRDYFEQIVPRPVQYAVDPDYGIFGFFRPADGEVSKQTRTGNSFLNGTSAEVQEAFPCATLWDEDYWAHVHVTGQWYTMGCRLYKFYAPDTEPYTLFELQDQYQNQSGVIQYFTYRHFGLNTDTKEIYVVRCSGKHNIFSLPNKYGGDYESMRFTMQLYVDIPTWDNFYECNPFYLSPKDYSDVVEVIEFEDNNYTNRDVLVLDYDFSIKYAIGPSSIDGLHEDDVIQHVIGKNGYIFIFTQVKEAVPYDWGTLFKDWFLEDTELLQRYGHFDNYVTYRKARLYVIRGSLKGSTAKLLYEINNGTFGQDNIVIQEVTDTHVWLNWDGIRPFMRGPLSSIGVRLDGTGIDEVPGLVAVVNGVYEDGWQLITYSRTESLPTQTNASRYAEVYPTGFPYNSGFIYAPEYESKAQQMTFWGNLVGVYLGWDNTYRRKYLSHLTILDEATLNKIAWDGSSTINSPTDMYLRIYNTKPACQPAVSQFFILRYYDWVQSDVTLKGELLLSAPTTWISINNGTGVVVL